MAAPSSRSSAPSCRSNRSTTHSTCSRAAGRSGKLSSFPETAIVPGGRSGIGAAIVAALEAEGTDLEVLDLADGFDVSSPRDWESVPPAELVCLNAGVLTGESDIRLLGDDEYSRAVRTNVDGVVFGVRQLAPLMP